MTNTVLLLGGGGSAGWNFAKAVQADGWHVIAADTDRLALELAPTPDRVLLASPGERTPEDLNAVIADWDVDVVHAQPDGEVSWLAAASAYLNAATLVPSRDAVDLCGDKLGTAQALGRELAPKSYNASIGALDRGLDGNAWMRLRRGAGSSGALPIRGNAQMEMWIEHHHRNYGVTAGEWMIAEILPGRDLSWTGVYRDGVLLASACKERVRPMARGMVAACSTASVQTIVVRGDVNERCERAVQRIDPAADGVWMIDLREDADGVPMVTEINCGRFGTTSLFWAEAGGNMPAIYLSAALGEAGAPWRDCCTEGATWVRQPDAGCVLAPSRVAA